jgi:predicted aspartyl protease
MLKWITGAFAALLVLSSAMAEEDCRLTLAASLPIDPHNSHRVIIPAEIDGKPLRLIIDTGSGHTGLTKHAAERLGLEAHVITSGFTPNFPYAGGRAKEFVWLKSFKLADMRADRVEFFVLDADWKGDYDGLLGADFLHQFDVEFDFAANKLNLFAPHPCKGKVVYWTHDAPVAVIPFENEQYDRHIRFDMTLDGKTVPTVLDTGAPSTSISIAMASAWFQVDEKTPGVEALNGQYHRARFKALTLDGITVENPEITLLPEVNARGANYEGLLGMNVLRQLHVFVAYKEHKLYVTSATAH